MATKSKTFQEYIKSVVDQAGSDYAVGKHLGYGDGSRVGIWKRNQGRPDELACIKLARWMGDDPVLVLRLAGYNEMADLLDGRVIVTAPSIDALRPTLRALDEMIQAALRMGSEEKRK